MSSLILIALVGLNFAIFKTTSGNIFAQTDATQSTEQAETDASESTDSAELDEQVRESMLERVRNVTSREQVQGALYDLLSQKGGYMGEITRISEEAITLSTSTGSVIVPLQEGVSILEDDAIIAVDSIEVGSWATVLGNRVDEQIEPEFVVVSEETLQPPTQRIVVGSIFEISRTALTITARDGGSETTFTIDSDSVFEDQDGEAATWQDFDADYAVLVVAIEDPETEDEFIVSTVRSMVNLSDLSEDATNE